MNSLQIKVRSTARKLGLIRLINKLRTASAYEERFHAALVEGIKPGDVVWDVGANVGLYTEQFCQWVGDKGAVVAFEPGVEAYNSIHERIPDCAWLTIENSALSDADMVGQLAINEGSSVDNQIVAGEIAADAKTIPVTIHRAETVWRRLGKTPNAVKIDVEGFEEEVLNGFGPLLVAPELRNLFVEVHFSKLEARGRADAPVRIEKLLKSGGFTTTWVDPSHIVAKR